MRLTRTAVSFSSGANPRASTVVHTPPQQANTRTILRGLINLKAVASPYGRSTACGMEPETMEGAARNLPRETRRGCRCRPDLREQAGTKSGKPNSRRPGTACSVAGGRNGQLFL